MFIGQLFLNHIAKNTHITEEDFAQIDNIIKSNPKALSSPDLLKLNRCVSYMTFILKEAYDFYALKSPDGVSAIKLRQIKKEVDQLKDKVEKWKSFIVQ